MRNNFCTFDIEASDWTNFKVLGFFDGDNFTTFRNIPDFIRFALQKKFRGIRLYAHYGGKYDFLFLLSELFRQSAFKVDIIEAGGRIITIKVSKEKHNWYFCDSFALLPLSLKDVTKGFDVEHKKLDFDVEKETDFTSPESLKYLENDCRGLYEVIEKFSQWGNNNGKLRPTLASQAMYIFRKHYLTRRLFVVGSFQEEFIRKCYYGGRCEIFKMYGKDLNYYDVNSMYPYAMRGNMPCGNMLQVKKYYPGQPGFYRLKVHIPYNHIPFVPKVLEGKLIFGVGHYEAYLASPEIELLEEKKIPFEFIDGFVFEDAQPIFKDYVDYFYSLKNKAVHGGSDYIVSKLFLNSLYGKFAQRRERENIVRVSDFGDIAKEHLTPYFEELGLYKKKTFSKSEFILPYLSAYITSVARVKLYRYIEQAGFDKVYYCDTDSIITSATMPESKDLGGLKKEYTIKEAVFIQPKVYALRLEDKTIVRIKGFIRHNLSFADFKEALHTGNIEKINATFKRIAGYKETIRRFKNSDIHRISQVKRLNNIYSKRLINKYDTAPLLINNP